MLDAEDKLKPEWRALLIGFQDRILFATDCHINRRWKKYRSHVTTYRSLLGQLPEYAGQNIAYRNAEKLYGVKIDAKDTR